MNKKLKLALKHRSSEQGFAMPIVMGLGLIMLLIAATLGMRSQDDQVTALVQRDTAQSLSLSEIGVTRTLAAFKKYGTALKEVDYDTTAEPFTDTWSVPITDNTEESNLIGTGVNGKDRWVSLSTTGQIIGHFKIVKYIHDSPSTGIGTLEVIGTTDTDTTTLKSTDTPQTGKSHLSVQISYPSLSVLEWQRKE